MVPVFCPIVPLPVKYPDHGLEKAVGGPSVCAFASHMGLLEETTGSWF